MTGFYLRRPDVAAEFERGKKQTMALAQKGIAAVLVGSWGLTFLGTPLPDIKAKPGVSDVERIGAASFRRGLSRQQQAQRPFRRVLQQPVSVPHRRVHRLRRV